MSIKLSDSVIVDSPDGVSLRTTSPVSSNIRTRTYAATNTEFNYKIYEITKAHDSDLFDAVGVFTDNANIWLQPANTVLLGCKIRLDVQFSSGGPLTDLDVTVGDGGNNTGILNPVAMNGCSDAVGTEYKDRGLYWNTVGGLYKATATQWLAYSASMGANLDNTSAGQVTFYFFYLEI